jgi:Putative Actinobacterial Holin-X, holin superfamily III
MTELVKQLAEETGTLFRQEIQLARVEMLEKIELVRSEATHRAQQAKEDFARDMTTVKDEVAEKGKRAGLGAGLLAGAGAVALVALAVLAALLARLLDSVMPSAVALAIVLLLYLTTAAALALLGRDRIRAATPLLPMRGLEQLKRDARAAVRTEPLNEAWPPVPEQTIETLKEDVEWAKHPKRSGETSRRREAG